MLEGLCVRVLDAVLLGVWDPVFVIVCSAVILPLTVAVLLGLCDGVPVPERLSDCVPDRVCVSVGDPE